MTPHAVESHFRVSGEPKRRQVACVGRWQDVAQKRPWLLMEVIGSLVAGDERVSVVIAGNVSPKLDRWHRSLSAPQRDRVQLCGRVKRDELAAILRESQVFYSPSAFESFGIAAAEALCSGCSVVAGRSVSLASFEWFVAENSGTLAAKDDSQSHASALRDELAAWQEGRREAQGISRLWCERLHADKVAGRILDFKLGGLDSENEMSFAGTD
jgi:glycosyltransferase involved in cell wall biosynthesis